MEKETEREMNGLTERERESLISNSSYVLRFHCRH